MATTAKGTPYVESSDLVANYPAVSLALAEHIDDIGKILQVVRATDGTVRSTTSSTYVDVTGMSVTITPQRDTSAVIIIAFLNGAAPYTTSTNIASGYFQITDSLNNGISGAAENWLALLNVTSSGTMVMVNQAIISGYATPATTSAVTYKLRFKRDTSSTGNQLNLGTTTSQIYAIEVSA